MSPINDQPWLDALDDDWQTAGVIHARLREPRSLTVTRRRLLVLAAEGKADMKLEKIKAGCAHAQEVSFYRRRQEHRT